MSGAILTTMFGLAFAISVIAIILAKFNLRWYRRQDMSSSQKHVLILSFLIAIAASMVGIAAGTGNLAGFWVLVVLFVFGTIGAALLYSLRRPPFS
ncbi:MAG: hypothetical protein ACLP9K_04610 [Nitrososphaerales archaeon]